VLHARSPCPCHPPFTRSRFTPAETLAAIDQLLDTSTDAEVATQLNARGYRTFTGLPFQATHVSQLRRAHGLKDRLARLQEAGMRTAAEVAAHLGVSEQTVWRWYRRGWIMAARDNDRGTCVFVPPETAPPTAVAGGSGLSQGHDAGNEVQYATCSLLHSRVSPALTPAKSSRSRRANRANAAIPLSVASAIQPSRSSPPALPDHGQKGLNQDMSPRHPHIDLAELVDIRLYLKRPLGTGTDHGEGDGPRRWPLRAGVW